MSPQQAAEICAWICTPSDLRWLAPSETWPLTSEKVIGWKRAGGWAFVFAPAPVHGCECADNNSHELKGIHSSQRSSAAGLLAYGELNPMRGEDDHFWLGHVIVNPRLRGRGVGGEFVRCVIRRGVEGLGLRRVSLIVFPENYAAVACYRSAGFREVGEERHRCAEGGSTAQLTRMEYVAKA